MGRWSAEIPAAAVVVAAALNDAYFRFYPSPGWPHQTPSPLSLAAIAQTPPVENLCKVQDHSQSARDVRMKAILRGSWWPLDDHKGLIYKRHGYINIKWTHSKIVHQSGFSISSMYSILNLISPTNSIIRKLVRIDAITLCRQSYSMLLSKFS